jgi:ketosteroid isomerase-like protein
VLWSRRTRCARLVLGLQSVAVSVSLSREDINHIREGYRLFMEGDPAFLDLYEPDATMVVPESLPKGGTFGSPLEALEFFNNVGELFEAARPEPEEFMRDGDRLVVLGHFHGRSRVTGEQVAIRFAHVYGLPDAGGPLREQRYTSFELIMDSAAVLSALVKQSTG